MTNSPNTMNPTGADPLATLVTRYRRELEADDTDDSDSAFAKWTWQMTWRQIERAPVLTKADALASTSSRKSSILRLASTSPSPR